MEVNGKIYRIDATKTFASGFQKRTVIVQSGKNFYPLNFKEGDISMIDMYRVGDDIAATFDVWGNKWINKDNQEIFFVDLSAKLIASPDKLVIKEAEQGVADMKAEPISLTTPSDFAADLPF